MNRRSFLALSLAGAVVGVPSMYLLRRKPVARQVAVKSSKRPIRTAVIGLGNAGAYHAKKLAQKSTLVSICDVHESCVSETRLMLNSDIVSTSDYREVIDNPNVDAVVIATPDHWHEKMAIEACLSGKDVYLETPLSDSIESGRRIVNVVKRTKRIVQVGAHGRSNSAARKNCEYLRHGIAGRITGVQCWCPENGLGHPADANATQPPSELDWEQWLGKLDYRPYSPALFGEWRMFDGIGSGQLNGIGAQILGLASWFLELDHTGPVHVATEHEGIDSVTGLPNRLKATWRFENPDVEINWEQPGQPFGAFDHASRFIGEKDSLLIGGGSDGVSAQEKVWAYKPAADAERIEHSPGHLENWLDCILSRETPRMAVEAGHRVASLCHLANISRRIGKPVRWDPMKEEFIG